MAYAALNSLMYTIDGLSRISIPSSTGESLQCAYDHASSLGQTLSSCSEGVTDIEELIIIEEARKLEDAIEFSVPTDFLSQSIIGEGCPPTFSLNLHHLIQDIDCFAKTVKEMQENIEELWDQKVAKMIEEYIVELFVQKTEEEEVSSAATEECEMVGLSDQFLQIRDNLIAATKRAEYHVSVGKIVVWISGMAGIGKTTLAKKLFHDPWVKANFECRAFVTVGQEFKLKEIFQAITVQLNLDNEKMIMEGYEDFHESFCRILTVRKTLIVLDEVWCNFLSFDLINERLEDKGSRILLTSRKNACYVYLCNLKMRFMNEEESWELLRRKVFGDLECPPLLVKPGKKIAEKCEGLPLLIIAVAPILLSRAQKIPECWNRVAEKPHSVLEDASHQISEVLLSSYQVIEEDLKMCFLYIVAFPQNCIVRRSTIVNLWCAEGYYSLTHNYAMLLEENLVVGHQKCWYSDYYKACRLHCAYWYVSKRLAENNKFLYIINSYADGLEERVKSHRRLAIYNNALLAFKELVHNKIASISTIRSLLCTGPYHQYQVPICSPEWKLLTVLHALTIRFYTFPVEVVKLIRLRYLALTCNANLPPSISKLWNLEVLIVHQHFCIKRIGGESYVPMEVWDLQKLMHLQIMGRNLPDPRPGAVLPDLVELLDVGVESCTKEVLESIPCLEKLRIQIELAPHATETMSCFDHISCLDGLRSFGIAVMYPTILRPPAPLSISTSWLRRLSLSGFGYPWEDMSKIAQLPYLQVLKLQCYAFRGEKWEPKREEFASLWFLFIEDTDLVQWTAGDETFLGLRRLTMKNCHKLQEIPLFSSIYMDDNEVLDIELVDCNPLAETCANQRYSTVERVKVSVNYSWKEEKLKL